MYQYFYGRSHTYEKRKNTTAVQPIQQKLFSNKKLAALLIPLTLDQLLNSFMGTVVCSHYLGCKNIFFSAISYPFIALYDDGSSIFRAQENSRLPMLISIWANVLNLVLNLVFVWVFRWGVAGSASATMIARIFSMLAVMYRLRSPELEIPLKNYFSIRPNWGEIKRILHIGIPSGVENSMFQFGKLAIQSTVSLMRTAAIAAQGMTNIIKILTVFLQWE